MYKCCETLISQPNIGSRTDDLLSGDGKVSYPKVVKVASTHSGYGKIRVRNEDDMADVRSILILNKDFYSLGPLYRFLVHLKFTGCALWILLMLSFVLLCS